MEVERSQSMAERILEAFKKRRDYYASLPAYKNSPDLAAKKALVQTLYPGNFREAGVQPRDINSRTSVEVARVLLKEAGPQMREIVDEFGKGKFADTLLLFDLSDKRTQKIVASARRILRTRK